MTHVAPRRRRRGFGWGIAATVLAGLGILSVGIVLLLAFSVDENYGWLLIAVLPFSMIAGAVGSALAIVGLILAGIDRTGFSWPAIGLVLGAGQLLVGAALVGGWFA